MLTNGRDVVGHGQHLQVVERRTEWAFPDAEQVLP
jgi:hypothetical protein